MPTTRLLLSHPAQRSSSNERLRQAKNDLRTRRYLRCWQMHGHEILEIDPPLAEGLPVQIDKMILERAPPDLSADPCFAAKAVRAILRLAGWSVETFRREAGEILPASQT